MGVGVLLVLFDKPHCTFREGNFVQTDKTFNSFSGGRASD